MLPISPYCSMGRYAIRAVSLTGRSDCQLHRSAAACRFGVRRLAAALGWGGRESCGPGSTPPPRPPQSGGKPPHSKAASHRTPKIDIGTGLRDRREEDACDERIQRLVRMHQRLPDPLQPVRDHLPLPDAAATCSTSCTTSTRCAGARPAAWMQLFDERYRRNDFPYGSGVWGKKEWVVPFLDNENIVSTYEGGTNLLWAERYGTHARRRGSLGQAVRQLAHRLVQGPRHDRAGARS